MVVSAVLARILIWRFWWLAITTSHWWVPLLSVGRGTKVPRCQRSFSSRVGMHRRRRRIQDVFRPHGSRGASSPRRPFVFALVVEGLKRPLGQTHGRYPTNQRRIKPSALDISSEYQLDKKPLPNPPSFEPHVDKLITTVETHLLTKFL